MQVLEEEKESACSQGGAHWGLPSAKEVLSAWNLPRVQSLPFLVQSSVSHIRPGASLDSELGLYHQSDESPGLGSTNRLSGSGSQRAGIECPQAEDMSPPISLVARRRLHSLFSTDDPRS